MSHPYLRCSVAITAVDEGNTLYAKPGFKPGQLPPPPPPRQCYTQSTSTENKGNTTTTVYVITDGWPSTLVFTNGMLPASAASSSSKLQVSLVGAAPKTTAVGSDHVFKVASRGNGTIVITVPAIPLSELPPASVESKAFAFRLVGAEPSQVLAS